MANPENVSPHRWPPGVSGNPSGSSDRQRVTMKLRRLIDQKELDGLLATTWLAAAVGDEELLKGRKPSYVFFRELLDRLEGKLPDKLEAQVSQMPAPIFQRIDNPRDKDLPPMVGADGRVLDVEEEPPPDAGDR
jgi:hypothetical protein